MIEIRSERPEDYAAIRALIVPMFHETYGSGEAEATLVEQLRQSTDYDPSLSLVALDGDTLVGHALFSRVTIASPGGDVEALALAPLGVLKPYRRQGLGARLVTAGLERGQTLGYAAVFVQGSPHYYGRFGFVPMSSKGLITPFTGIPDAENMVVELVAGGVRGVSGRVQYPPPWNVFM
jgi:putative acetyltransferase